MFGLQTILVYVIIVYVWHVNYFSLDLSFFLLLFLWEIAMVAKKYEVICKHSNDFQKLQI